MTIFKNRRQLAFFVLTLAVLVISSLCPDIGPMTKGDWLHTGAFLSIVIAWITGLPTWLGFVVTLYYCVSSGRGFEEVFPQIVSNSSVWLILFIYWFLASIKDSGLLEYFTRKMLVTRLAKKGVYWLMSAYFVTAFAASALTQCFGAVMVLLLMILGSTAETLGLPKYHPWTLFTGIGIAAFSSYGQILFPFNYVFKIYESLLSASTGVNAAAIPDGPLFVTVSVSAALSFAGTILLAKYVFKPDFDISKLSTLEIRQMPFTKTMGGALVSICTAIIIVVIPSLTPDHWRIDAFLSSFGTTAAFGAAALINCFVLDKQGKPLFDFADKMRDSIELWVFFMLAPLIYFGSAANGADAGLPKVLAAAFAPISDIDPYLLMCVLTMATILLTNIANNYVVCLITGPIAYSVFGFDGPMAMCYTAMMMTAAFLAFATPTAGIQGILLSGRKDMFRSGELIKHGYMMAAFYGVVISLTAFLVSLY